MSEKENSHNTTEYDKSNTTINDCNNNTLLTNLEENMALITISNPVNSMEENDTSFTLGGWNVPEERDTPVTIGGWDFSMENLGESNWDTPFTWTESYAKLFNEIETYRKYRLEESTAGWISRESKQHTN